MEKGNYNYCMMKLREGLASIGVHDPENYTEHSDRAGGLTDAVEKGCLLQDLEPHGRWKGPSCPKGYLKRSKQMKRKVSQMLYS